MTNKLYDIEYINNKNKSKFSPKQAINKFLIYINIKYNSNIKIICAWDKDQIEYLTSEILINKFPFIFVDYSQENREWYMHYNNIFNKIKYDAVIDDITGDINS